MNKLSLLKSVLLISSVSLLATGCVVREVRYRNPPPPPPPAYAVQPPPVAGGEVEVAGPPPAPIVETVTVAPDPAFIWIGGFWAWEGRWVWRPGHLDRPPRPGARWFAGGYVFRGGRHVWVRAGWR